MSHNNNEQDDDYDDDDDDDHDDVTDTSTTPPSVPSSSIGCWRAGDAAFDFLNQRYLQGKQRPKQEEEDGRRRRFAKPPTTMKYSNQFAPKDTCQIRLKEHVEHNKTPIIKFSFDAASTFVLENIYYKDDGGDGDDDDDLL